MLALMGLLGLAIASYMHFGFKDALRKTNEIKPEKKRDLLLITRCFLIGAILAEITGIVSLFIYGWYYIDAILFTLVCFGFPMGSALVSQWIIIFRKTR